MHELAHILCEHKCNMIGLDFSIGLMRNFNAVNEAEANCLGGCLQLPRAALLWALKKGMTKSEISEYYNCSVQMVTKRINETAVNRQLSYSRRN